MRSRMPFISPVRVTVLVRSCASCSLRCRSRMPPSSPCTGPVGSLNHMSMRCFSAACDFALVDHLLRSVFACRYSRMVAYLSVLQWAKWGVRKGGRALLFCCAWWQHG